MSVRLRSVALLDGDQMSHLELAPPPDKTGRPWVSVIIGRNGTGKSRLLAAIVDSYIAADRGRVMRRSPREVRLVTSRNDLEQIIGPDVSPNPTRGAMPAKVVAVATTPFDKFAGVSSSDSIYEYVGLRSDRGQVSSRAAVFRAVENLFAASGGNAIKRSRIASIFERLGYSPDVRVQYRWSYRFSNALPSDDPLARLVESPANSRLQSQLRRDPNLMDKAYRALKLIADRHGDSGGLLALDPDPRREAFSLRASFREVGDEYELFTAIQTLVKVGALSTSAIGLNRISNGQEVDLMSASSGELALVTAFLGIASVIEDDSLVIIDEPEVSLHPEWQTGYVQMLLENFSSYLGCHFVVATHSPLILSDLDPRASTVLNLDGMESTDARKVSQRSSDELLATVFGVPGHGNLYVKELLVELLRLLAEPEVSRGAISQALNRLDGLLSGVAADDPARMLVDQARRMTEAD